MSDSQRVDFFMYKLGLAERRLTQLGQAWDGEKYAPIPESAEPRGHYVCPYCHATSDSPLNEHRCGARPR